MLALRLFTAALLIAAIQPASAKDLAAQGADPAAAEVAGDPEVGPLDWETYDLPTDGSFSTIGDTPPETGLVQRIFELSFAEPCEASLAGAGGGPSPEVFDLEYQARFDAAGDPPRRVRLYQFFCNLGAYNGRFVYMTWEAGDGLRPVVFSYPKLDITYENDENAEGKVLAIGVTGLAATPIVVNAWYDPAARTISTVSYWRGLGDASSIGVYAFDDGEFVLRTYDVDGSYDGEVNPFRVVDYTAPVQLDLVPAEPIMPPVEDLEE